MTSRALVVFLQLVFWSKQLSFYPEDRKGWNSNPAPSRAKDTPQGLFITIAGQLMAGGRSPTLLTRVRLPLSLGLVVRISR